MPLPLTWIVVSTTTTAVAAAGGIVLARARRLDARTVLLAAGAALATLAALLFVAVFVEHRFFLGINVLYCAWSIAFPLLGAGLLLAGLWREVTRGARMLAGISLLSLPVALYATFVEPYRLETVRTDVAIAPERQIGRALTIAVLSDLQMVSVTEHERDAVERALAAKPDLILLPGDFVQIGTHRIPEILPEFHALMARLDAPLGVYCVQGDCETKEDIRVLFADTRVRFLDNETVSVEHGGVRLRLCGVQRELFSPGALAALSELEALAEDPGELRLLVAHRPEAVYQLQPDTRVDLVVAGHTHGGQVQLPWLGPPFILSIVPRAVGAGGLHELDGRRLYVSRGVGWEHGNAPRVRFLCRPEVSILTLAPEAEPAR